MKKTRKEILKIEIGKHVGSFAENKDTARKIRLEYIFPGLERGAKVVLDFSKVDSSTQSFIHALISDVIRRYGADVLDRISFKNCNETVKKIIRIVVRYMQHAEESFPSEE